MSGSRERVERALRRWLDGEPHLAAAWLFGSFARGDARADSDVDVAVLTAGGLDPDARFRARLRWGSRAEAALAACGIARRLDLVVLDDAPPLLVHAALRDGALLLDRDPAYRVAFQERAFGLAMDARRLRDEAMRARARRFGVELP